MSSYLCFLCHSTVNDETNEETREKYKEVVGIHLCPDSHLCYICCHVLHKLFMFRSICLKRSLEYPVLFSEKGTINLHRSDIEINILCPEDCDQYQVKQYQYDYNNDFSDNHFNDNNFNDNQYVELEDEYECFNKNQYDAEKVTENYDYVNEKPDAMLNDEEFHNFNQNFDYYKYNEEITQINNIQFNKNNENIGFNYNDNRNNDYSNDLNQNSFDIPMYDYENQIKHHIINEAQIVNRNEVSNKINYKQYNDNETKFNGFETKFSNCQTKVNDNRNNDNILNENDTKFGDSLTKVNVNRNNDNIPNENDTKFDDSQTKVNVNRNNDNISNENETKIDESQTKVNENRNNDNISDENETKIDESQTKVNDNRNNDNIPSENEIKFDDSQTKQNDYQNNDNISEINDIDNKQNCDVDTQFNDIHLRLNNETSDNYTTNNVTRTNTDEMESYIGEIQDDVNTEKVIKKKKKKGFKKIVLSLEEQKKKLDKNRKSKKYTEAEFKCYNCALGFLFKDTYQAHMMRHEESNGEFRCDTCTLRFTTHALLRTHNASHSVIYKCLKCGDVIKPRAKRTHPCFKKKVDESVACYLCGKLFRDSNGLQQHLRRVHAKASNRLHSCTVCNENFTNPSVLKTHMIKHINRKFQCDKCPAMYKSPYTLAEHKKKHEIFGEKHRCTICDAIFDSRKSLLSHVRRTAAHQNTVLECPMCGRLCASQSALEAHLQSHAPAQFSCSHCANSYTNRKALLRHLKRHAGLNVDSAAVCHLCGNSFKGKNKLNRHLKQVCEKEKLEEQLAALYD